MGKKINEEIISQIPLLYQELGVKKKVAEALGISVSTVSKYLSIYEAAPLQEKQKQKEKKRTKITEEIIQKINELYPQYKNLSKVAKELGIAASTVKRYLNEENLRLIEDQNADRDALWYYIFRLFGQYSEDKPVSDWNITQMQRFRDKGMPYRGQLLTLKYFYEIKKNSIDKSNGSIGIIPHIYSEAENYYRKKAIKSDEITKAIQKQLEKDRIEIKYNPNDYINQRKKKKMIDINQLGE